MPDSDEPSGGKARAAFRATLLVAFAVVPAGSVLIGVPYLLYRRRKRRQAGE